MTLLNLLGLAAPLLLIDNVIGLPASQTNELSKNSAGLVQ